MAQKDITGDSASPTLPLVKGDNLITLEALTMGASTQLILQTRTDAAGIWCDHIDPMDSSKLAQISIANATTGGGGYGRHFTLTGPGEVRVWGVNFAGTTQAKLRTIDAEAR